MIKVVLMEYIYVFVLYYGIKKSTYICTKVLGIVILFKSKLTVLTCLSSRYNFELLFI